MFDGDVKGSRFTAKLITKTPKYPYVASKSSNKSPRTYQHDQRQNTTSNIFMLCSFFDKASPLQFVSQTIEIVKYMCADTAETVCGRSLAWSRT